MAYPSTFSTFNRPGSSDRLNNPSHSALHNTVSSALGQVEAVIGLSGNSSTLGTIIGDLRSPDSNGGGHVQTANKGGTGQTSYTKGDLLVATSSSVLAKLAVSSTTGEVLTADTTQAAGLKWAAPTGATKVAIKNSVISIDRWQASVFTTIFSASVAGSILGDNKGIKFKGIMPKWGGDATDTVTFRLDYGSNTVASVVTTVTSTLAAELGNGGVVEGAVLAQGSSSVQSGFIQVSLSGSRMHVSGFAVGTGTSSITSDAPQSLDVKVDYNSNQTASSILSNLFIVEKII